MQGIGRIQLLNNTRHASRKLCAPGGLLIGKLPRIP